MTQQPRMVRAFATDLEIRGDGRTIVGLAAPFNTPTDIVDYAGAYSEIIAPGAFKRTIAERGPAKVKLLAQHDDQSFPIGKAVALREDTAGLVGEFRIAQTVRGEEALALIRDGVLDGLSIGFRTVRDQWSPDRRERRLLEARLDEVSLVSHPAYETARVHAVRAATQPLLLAAQRELLLRKALPPCNQI